MQAVAQNIITWLDQESSQPTIAAFNKVACIGGVVIASRWALRQWIAAQGAPKPDVVVKPGKPQLEHDVESGELPKKKKISWKAIRSFLITFFGMLFVEGLIIFGLPKLKSQLILDAFWTLLQSSLVTFQLIHAYRTFCSPLPQGVRWTKNGHLQLGIRLPYDTDDTSAAANAWRARRRMDDVTLYLFTASATLVWIAASIRGWSILNGVIAAAMAAQFSGGLKFARMRLKYVFWIVGLYVGTGAFVGAIMGLFALFPEAGARVGAFLQTKQDVTLPDGEVKSELFRMSDWVLSLMQVSLLSVAVAVPGIVCAAALRFDWEQYKTTVSGEPILLELDDKEENEAEAFKAGETEKEEGAGKAEKGLAKALLPSKLPNFPKPTFYSAIFTLASMWLLDGYFAKDVNAELSQCAAMIAIVGLPLMVAAMTVSAWCRGSLKELWDYEERWVLPPTDLAGPVVKQEESDEVQVASLI